MRPLRDIPGMDRRPRRPRRPARGGFTLIELLVAMAIFITVMGGVTLLFNSAIRTTKQGYLNQDAFEIARGAMDILERDLTRSFTSRDHGDVFNFYGTPIGFTFVSMITADESSNPNLARVTYVMYHDFANVAGAVSIYQTIDGIDIPTYNLIRYIEPGGEDLESFPVDWSVTLNPDDASPTDLPFLLTQLVNESPCDADDSQCLEEALKAAKRELWIRMLSGGDDKVPSAWDFLDTFVGLDPFDFVIAENIRHLTIVPSFASDNVDNDEDGSIDADDPDETITNAPGFPEIMLSDTANFDPTQGRVPFFTYREFGTRTRRDVGGNFVRVLDPLTGDPLFADPPDNLIPLFETEVAPIELRYWNDTRNVAYVQQQLLNFDPDDDIELNRGSPLDARAPIEIGVNFTLFFPSPYSGAPDFNRKFTMTIDLPTGYRRTFESPAPPSS